VRAGAYALTLLSVPLNVHVITALEDESLSLMDLRRAVGQPPQTTMRKHLKSLTELGVLERCRQPEFPGSVDFRLGPAGRDLLGVVRILQAWLANSPDGPVQPGSTAAKSAIKALVEGWSGSIVRALAARPLSLTELNRLIPALNYPSLERRLGAMRLAGQIASCTNGGRTRPYTATPWLRHAVAPLIVAASWERRHGGRQGTSLNRIDIESTFLLTVPMLRLPEDLTGSARFALDMRATGEADTQAGVVIHVLDGEVVSCNSRLRDTADAWVSGPIQAWLAAMIDFDVEALERGGDCELALALVERLHDALFRVPART
jgi:DNA-binding HxlR family transcriptional regulator